MRVFVDCNDDASTNVKMVLNSGHEIADDDRVRVSTNDFLATQGDGILTPGEPDGGYQYEDDPRLNRDLLVNWFKKHGGSLSADDFRNEAPRWNFSESFVAQCQNGV